jgi:diacylglycerol kinase family enzyme
MRAALLVNPRAGRGRKLLPELVRRFTGLGPVVVTGSQRDLVPQLRVLRDRGTDMLAVCGGDGTVHAAVAAARRVWGTDALPRFLLLHGGTMGLVHRELALPDALSSVDALAVASRRGAPVPEIEVPMLEIEGRAAFNLGLGMFVGISRQVGSRPNNKAVARFAAHLVASAAVGGRLARKSLEPWEGTIVCDGVPWKSGAMLGGYISALDRLWHFRGFSAVPRPPGHYRALMVDDAPMSEILRELPWFTAGRPVQHASVVAAKRVMLNSARAFSYMADGEIYEAAPGDLAITPGPQLPVALPHLVDVQAA